MGPAPCDGRADVVWVPSEQQRVSGRDAGGSAAALDTVQQHCLTLRSQRPEGVGRVVEQELQVRVLVGTLVEQPELDVLGVQRLGSHAAQADHRRNDR